MKNTYFDLMTKTDDLCKTLEKADWQFEYECWGTHHFEAEINGMTYYKVVYDDGSVLITDDIASAMGDMD